MGRSGTHAGIWGLVLALMAAVALVAAGGGAQADADGYHVVVFKDPPAAVAATEPGKKFDPQSTSAKSHVAHLKGAHGDYVRWLQRHAPQAEVVRDLVLAANAVAIDLNGADPALLSRGPGVKYTAPSTLYRPSMNASVELIDAAAAWSELGGRAGAGEGIDVGIIDTGIYADHPFFGEACEDEGFDPETNPKVVAAGVFFSGVTGVADDIRGGGVDIVFDHGTHVAGTVGGCVHDLPADEPVDDQISGVAPGVTLHDYNVFPGYGAGFVAFGGSAFSHDIAAALEQALADGVEVVNLSLGGAVQGPHDFLAEAVDAASAGGLISVVAAGNSGDTGTGDSTVESPGSAPSAITVGATTNSHVLGLPVTVEGFSDPLVGAVGDFGNFLDEGDDETYPGDRAIDDEVFSYWGDHAGDDLACSSIGPDVPGIDGTVALIQRGTCTFSTKVANAEQAGAIAVVVYNNAAGPPTAMGSSGTPATSIPATMISQSDGEAVLDALETDATLEVSIEGPATELPAEADVLAGFSSRGPTPFTYLAKPDLTAPGVNIFSSVVTWDPFSGTHTPGWAAFQGTSMATPHVAGAVALLLHEDEDLTLDQIRSALVNRAARVVTDPGADDDPGVLERGGGRLDVGASFGVGEFLTPAIVSFGYVNGKKSVAIDRTVEMTDGCEFVGATGDTANLTTDDSAGSSVTATFTADRGVGSGDYQGDLVFDCGGDELLAPWWVRVDRRG